MEEEILQKMNKWLIIIIVIIIIITMIIIIIISFSATGVNRGVFVEMVKGF